MILFFLSVGARVIRDGLRQGLAEMSIHILVGERVGYRPNNRFVGFPVQPRAYTSRSVRQESASDTSQHWNGVVSGVLRTPTQRLAAPAIHDPGGD